MWTMYKSYKIVWEQQLLTPENPYSKIVVNNSNLLFPATNIPNHRWKLSKLPAYDQNSVLNSVEMEKLLIFASCDVQLQKNLTQYYPYDPKKLTNHSILHPEADLVSICRDFFKKTAFFDVVVHLID